jgi:DNA polymerase-3 subunit delta'
MTRDAALAPPWLEAQIGQLRRARASGRFPPALLIQDRRGAGGLWLARFAAQLALCRQPEAPCGRCRECRQFLAGQHPDFFDIEPIEDSKYIRIEQIRTLIDALSLTAHGGGATVAILHPADTLHLNATHALLKTLEEPRAGVTLILVTSVTSVPSQLPPTILSRCQKLRIPAPTRAQSLAYLERQGSGPWAAVLDVIGEAPFEARQFDPAEVAGLAAETFAALKDLTSGRGDPGALADRWAHVEQFELRLTCIETWLTACIDRTAGGAAQLRELRTGAHLPESSWDMNTAALLHLLDAVYELRGIRLISINRAVALEQLLWQLVRMRAGAAAAS